MGKPQRKAQLSRSNSYDENGKKGECGHDPNLPEFKSMGEESGHARAHPNSAANGATQPK